VGVINWEDLNLEEEYTIVNERYIQVEALIQFMSKEIMTILDDETIRDYDNDPIYIFLQQKRQPLRQEWSVLLDVRMDLSRLIRKGKRIKLKAAK
jgi:hypothetical protein